MEIINYTGEDGDCYEVGTKLAEGEENNRLCWMGNCQVGEMLFIKLLNSHPWTDL